jgi:hypothetical protein
MPHKLFDLFGKFMFFLIALVLVVMGVVLAVTGVWEAFEGIRDQGLGASSLLNSVGFIVVSVAIIDLSKFVVEEYVLHDRELPALPEARRSLTKFMTIIIIALALESLVATFEVSREKLFPQLVYPAVLMLTSVLTLVGVGAFQWMTRAGERKMIEGAGDAIQGPEADEVHEPGDAGSARPQQRRSAAE